jgi:hypothetical protein
MAPGNIVVAKIDPATGAATVQNDPADATRVSRFRPARIETVVATSDKMAYVLNYVSRDVTVIDLSGAVERVAAMLSLQAGPRQGRRRKVRLERSGSYLHRD